MGCLKNSRGAVMIYAILFLFVLGIFFIALGIDVGWMAYVRSQGQAAVDSAAISGAAAIPAYNSGDPTQVYGIVGSLNSQNTVMSQDAAIANTDVEFCTGDPEAGITCTAATTPAVGVRVTKTYSTPLFFAKVLNGGNPTDITVSATAWLGGPAGLGPDLPLAVCASQIGYNGPGSTCDPTLQADLSANNVDNAGWFTVPPDSANAKDCKDMVTGLKEIPFLYGGQEVNLNNGQITACQWEIYFRFESCFASVCPDCCNQSSPNYNPDCVVTLPVIDCANTINQQEDILLFASLCITNVIAEPADQAEISSTLVCDVEAPGSVGGGFMLGTYAGLPVLLE